LATIALPVAAQPDSLATRVTTADGEVSGYATGDLGCDAVQLTVTLPELASSQSEIQVGYAPL